MSVLARVVSVDTSATLLSDPTAAVTLGDRRTVIVRNASAGTVFVGGAGVTTGTGFSVPQNAGLSLDLGPGDILYGIVAASTSNLEVLETRA